MVLIEHPDRPPRNVRRLTGGSSASDQAATMRSQIADLDALGGGTIELEGTVGFTGLIDVPNGVNVVGVGSGETAGANENGTQLVALDAAAQLRFGVSGAGQYGGVSGNFVLNANNLATNPMYVGLAEGRSFDTIRVIKAAAGGAALTLAATQNCVFRNIKLNNNASDGLVFDLGCGGNTFHGLFAATNNGDAVKFTQSGVSPSGAHPYPSDNHIFGFLIEHSTNPNVGKSLVYHGAGINNSASGGTLSMTGASAARNIVTMVKEAGQLSEGLVLGDVWWAGNQTWTTAIDLAFQTGCSLTGRHRAGILLRFFHAADGSLVDNNAEFGTLAAVTDWFVSPTATAFAENTIVRHRSRSPLQILRPTSADTVLTLGVDGGDPRLVIDANGGHAWGSGTGATDTNLYRQAANHLKTDDKLQVVGEAEIDGALNHDGTTAGFIGATPVGVRTLGAAATDAATTQTLANNLRQALIDLGLGQT